MFNKLDPTGMKSEGLRARSVDDAGSPSTYVYGLVMAGLALVALSLLIWNADDRDDATPPSFSEFGPLLLVPIDLPAGHTVRPVEFESGQGIAEYLVYDDRLDDPTYTSYCVTRSGLSFDRARSACAEDGAISFQRGDLFVSVSGPLTGELADARWTAEFAETTWER